MTCRGAGGRSRNRGSFRYKLRLEEGAGLFFVWGAPIQTIAVIASKGGAGKTTVALHLAFASYLRGSRTLLVDTDPQRSASAVLQARGAPGPAIAASSGPKLFALQLQALRSGVQTLIIDTPAGAEADAVSAVVLATVSAVVLRPTFLDIAAAPRTIDIVNRLKRRGLVVINQAPPMRDGAPAPVVRRACAALDVLRAPACRTWLHSRLVYQTALENGRSAEESDDTGAAREIEMLWSEVQRCAAN